LSQQRPSLLFCRFCVGTTGGSSDNTTTTPTPRPLLKPYGCPVLCIITCPFGMLCVGRVSFVVLVWLAPRVGLRNSTVFSPALRCVTRVNAGDIKRAFSTWNIGEVSSTFDRVFKLIKRTPDVDGESRAALDGRACGKQCQPAPATDHHYESLVHENPGASPPPPPSSSSSQCHYFHVSSLCPSHVESLLCSPSLHLDQCG
jgi:hypothetical protein